MEKKNFQQGFTMIELMIVVVIIGILAALAVMTFEQYSVRSKVKEGLDLVAPAKNAVSEFFASKSRLPGGNTSSGLPQASSIGGRYVSTVTVGSSGTITIAFNSAEPKLSSKSLVLSPTTSSGTTVKWTCGASGTTLEDKYLPAECR